MKTKTKWGSLLLAVMLLFALLVPVANAADKTADAVVLYIGSSNAMVNGTMTKIDPANANVVPIETQGRTLVPVRFIAEALGADVSWEESNRTATIILGASVIDITMDQPNMLVDGEAVALDVPAQQINDRTLVPLRAISQAFGKEVFYDRDLIVISGIKDIFDVNADKAEIDRLIAKLNGQDVGDPAPSTGSDSLSIASEDGGWCWFGDPRAVHYKGIHDRTYMGWIDEIGRVVVAQYDHDTKEMLYNTLKERFQKDDHNNPSFFVRPDGKVIIFYAKHSSEPLMYYRISKNPEDITDLEEEKTLPNVKENVTYPNPYSLSEENGKLYLFWRGIGWQPTCATSSDNGETWSDPVQVIQGNDRPYIKYESDGKSKIHFAFTDGHPRMNQRNKIYYMYYEKGAYYKSDGTLIKKAGEGPVNTSEAEVVYDGTLNGSPARGWIWDIALDENGYPRLVYTASPGDSNDQITHLYRYARLDGTGWHNYDLTDGGKWFPQTPEGVKEPEPHYAGGMILDHANPNIMYLSRPINGVFEIEKWVTADGGQNWDKTAITSNSKLDNVRPFVTRNGKPGEFDLLWMQNDFYVHYTNYHSKIMTNSGVGNSMTVRKINSDPVKYTDIPDGTIGSSVAKPVYQFDFGTEKSPVADGYWRVTEKTQYSQGSFGFLSTQGLQSRDRPNQSSLTERDMVLGGDTTTSSTFKVDLENGKYKVDIVMGDNDFGKWFKGLKVNGEQVSERYETAKGQFKIMSYETAVTGGALSIEFLSNGFKNEHWSMTSLVVTPLDGQKNAGVKEPPKIETPKDETAAKLGIAGKTPAYLFDFGTASSAIETGFTRVTELSKYSADTKFGWKDLNGLQARDRSTIPSALNKDFVLGGDKVTSNTFRVDVPNGTYQVDVVLGESDFVKKLPQLKINGNVVGTNLNTDVNEFLIKSYDVTVTNGAIELEFIGTGVANSHWSITALAVTQK